MPRRQQRPVCFLLNTSKAHPKTTYQSVNRYDGKTFKTFDELNSFRANSTLDGSPPSHGSELPLRRLLETKIRFGLQRACCTVVCIASRQAFQVVEGLAPNTVLSTLCIGGSAWCLLT
jgi:hypothetical protein